MTSSTNIKLITLTAMIAIGGAALADNGEHSERAAKRFAMIDADKDGQLTMEEIKAHAQVRFASRDANSDGFIDRGEMQQAMNDKKAERAARMIEKFDTDGDGKLDAQELEAMGSHAKHGRKGKHAKKHAKKMEKRFERMDENGDGMLDFAEMTARHDPAKMFEKLDADGNGTLSAEEYAKARHGGKHHKRKGG